VTEEPIRDLLSIGRFAAVTGLTVTALRHYDELGLLAPAHVDPATGYRWYESAQAPRADVIRRLRAVDVPLTEVAAVVDAIGDPARVRGLLDVHERRLAERAAGILATQDLLASLTKELETMSLSVDAESARVGPVAAVRIFTRDLDAARTFYRARLGLAELTARDRWAVFDGGSVQVIVELATPGDHDDDGGHEGGDSVGRFAGVSFSVDDAAAACDHLSSMGVEIVGRPARQPWGGTLAHVADPDRNVLTLVQYPPPA
jgi:DNA-binding transcriptional MerR regulator